MSEYATTKKPLSEARCDDTTYMSSVTDFETDFIDKCYRLYNTESYFCISTIKHKRSLAEVSSKERTREHLQQWFYPVINALYNLHENGLCHTSVKATNIFESENGYILSDVGKYYFYSNKNLEEKGFKIPEEMIERKSVCFEYKKDNEMLGELLEEYIIYSEIENKEDYNGIMKELKESKNDLDLLNLLHKYQSIFPKPSITVETILRREFYKLGYFEYPVIDNISISKYLEIIKSDIDEKVKYYLSVCLLNSISMNEERRIKISDEEFVELKEIFYEEIKRNNKDGLKELSTPINREIFEEVFKDRNTEEINLKKKIPTLSKYEWVLFSIILSCFENVKVLNLGKNNIKIMNTKHIIQGIRHYSYLKELSLNSMLFIYTSLKILSNIVKENQNLENLDMRGSRNYYINFFPIKKWNDGIKMVLENCPNLTYLNMKYNFLSHLDESLGILDGIKRMMKLKKINLRGNYFGVPDEYDCRKMYDEGIEKNGNILSKNDLNNRNIIINTGKYVSGLIERLFNLRILKLKSCTITDNIMIEICKSLNQLSQLEELNLEDNKLTEKSMYELGECIYEMRELRVLNISNNRINDNGICILFQNFENEIISLKLNEIIINKNKIHCEGFYHFLFFIRKHKSITKLSVNLQSDLDKNNEIDIALFKESMNYLKQLNNIEELTISNTRMGDSGIKIFSNVMKYLPKLKSLDIFYTMIKSDGLCELINEISNNCKNIESLLIEGNKICNELVIEFNRFLLSNLQLKKLSLSWNKLDKIHSYALAEAFKNLSNLEEFSVDNIKYSQNVLKTLFIYLKQNKKMKKLTIEYCDFDKSMILECVESLKQFNDLKELTLVGCNIRSKLMLYLKDGLKNLYKLEMLDLSYNHINSDGINYLCDCFDSLQNLLKLKIEYNLFGFTGINTLTKNIGKLLILSMLYISDNNFGEEGLLEILDVCEIDHRKAIQYFNKYLSSNCVERNLDKIVYLIKGEDRGRKTWYYLEMDKCDKKKFIAAAYSVNLNLDDYGTVIYSDYGENPPQDIKDKIHQYYAYIVD